MNESPGSSRQEQSFADVLNNLSGGPWRSPAVSNHNQAVSNHNQAVSGHNQAVSGHNQRSQQPSAEQLAIPWLASSRSAPDFDSAQARWPAAVEEWGEARTFASAVRPYTWTRGRTRPVYDLAVETLVSTSARGFALTSVEHRSVAELCSAPRSVAEVAALLGLPLGVARVLLGDMANLGLVVVHRTGTDSGDAPDFTFMERVLSGLRRL